MALHTTPHKGNANNFTGLSPPTCFIVLGAERSPTIPQFYSNKSCPFFLLTAIIPRSSSVVLPPPSTSRPVAGCARTRVCLSRAPAPVENRENRERAHIPGLKPSALLFLHSAQTRGAEERRGKELTVYYRSPRHTQGPNSGPKLQKQLAGLKSDCASFATESVKTWRAAFAFNYSCYCKTFTLKETLHRFDMRS